MNILESNKDLILNGSINSATIRVGRFGVVGIVYDTPKTVPISHFQKIGGRTKKQYGVMIVVSNVEIDSIYSAISDKEFENGNSVVEIISLT